LKEVVANMVSHYDVVAEQGIVGNALWAAASGCGDVV